MAESLSCVGSILHEGRVYIFDAAEGEAYSDRGPQLGAMTDPLDQEEYETRRQAVIETGDARNMFDHPDQYEVFGDGELVAYADYLAHGLGGLAFTDLVEHVAVIAYESRRTLSTTA
jgi:hypothetical protein